MKTILKFCLGLFFGCTINLSLAQQKILNIYIWGNYLPNEVIQQFTKETKIRVNIAEYDNNETMFAKLKASPQTGYDLVVPSSYYVERMAKQKMLQPLDKTKIPNISNLDPTLLKKHFDPNNDFSLPYLWGTTGIVVNTSYFPHANITKWEDLWQPQYNNQLMLLDDMREVFSIALLTLGYSINDTDPQHIKQAYLKLKALKNNVRLFNIDAVPNIYIDEDATIGMIWSGDCKLAQQENANLQYIYPQEGFAVWVDSIAIVRNAPHADNAHAFINFILRPEIAKAISLATGHSTPNTDARKLLPLEIQNNPVAYPDSKILSKGMFQEDISDNVLRIYNNYWEMLKIG